MYELSNRTIIDIVRRISRTIQQEGEPRLTTTAQYQLDRLSEIRGFDAFIKSEISRISKLALVEIDDLINKAMNEAYSYDLSRFVNMSDKILPPEKNAAYKQIERAISERTKREFQNLTRTTAIGFKGIPAQKYFISRLDQAAMQVSSGLFDYNTVIKRTVQEMTESGLQSISDKDKRPRVQYGGRNLNIVTAVRNTVLTSVRQMADEVSLTNGEALGLNLVELSAHFGARNTGTGFENHEQLQGKRYSLSSYDELREVLRY